MTEQQHPVILFDGVCNLCQSSVQFIISHDPSARFRFASLQSSAGEVWSAWYADKNNNQLNTIILVDGGVAYYRSTAILKILKILGPPWSFLYCFIILPVKMRDFVYDFIGQRRYKWFGKKDACWVPDEDLSRRFLD